MPGSPRLPPVHPPPPHLPTTPPLAKTAAAVAGGTIASLEEKYISLPRFDTVEAALRDGPDFDGAVLLLSNAEGGPAAIRLAKAGKHIVIEKPGVGSVEDAEAIAEAASNTGAVVTMSYTQRFNECAVRRPPQAPPPHPIHPTPPRPRARAPRGV